MNKESAVGVICLTCQNFASEGSDYCEECLKREGEKLGFELDGGFREGFDSVVESFGESEGGER